MPDPSLEVLLHLFMQKYPAYKAQDVLNEDAELVETLFEIMRGEIRGQERAARRAGRT